MGTLYSKRCSVCEESKDIASYYLRAASKDGLEARCKDCRARINNSPAGKAAIAKYSQSEARKESFNRYNAKEGYCVYIANYPEGKYIGSGQITGRRNNNLNGNSRIAKKLNSLANSFEVVYTGNREDCLEEEDRLIREVGLDNLLNTRHATV